MLDPRSLNLAAAPATTSAAIRSQTGCSGWGVDPSNEMLDKARSQESAVAWICATAENTRLTGIQFDFVFNVDAIHHFQDRAKVYSEINRLLIETRPVCIATDSERDHPKPNTPLDLLARNHRARARSLP
ncbi:MAG: class I SAM-dependent methyltransferase [Verrucomicrobia bacterium]|nr:class I SAM-dependent methyltransferase [Verrucomicrobiota bacterium]